MTLRLGVQTILLLAWVLRFCPYSELTRRMGYRAGWPPTLGRKALSEEVENPLNMRSRSNGALAECV